MEYVIGVLLAAAIALASTLVGFDRQRVFYPVMMIVIASYYGLFAVIGGSHSALTLEGLAMLAFMLVAIVGFKTNLWWVVVALLAHSVFDLVHARVIDNPGVPSWWPGFCLAYDAVAGAYLAGLLRSRRMAPNSTPESADRE